MSLAVHDANEYSLRPKALSGNATKGGQYARPPVVTQLTASAAFPLPLPNDAHFTGPKPTHARHYAHDSNTI